MFKKIKDWYHDLPDKKKYIEFITALLTVPFLLTVLISNLNSLNNNKKNQPTLTPIAAPTEKIVVITENPEPTCTSQACLTPTIVPSSTTPACKKEVGPVKITSPKEEEIVMNDPVCVNINYPVGEYCTVVWSYRINKGAWSDYSDKSFCLYNQDAGKKELDLRVKSLISDDELTLVRTFYYKSKETPSVIPSISPTPIPE